MVTFLVNRPTWILDALGELKLFWCRGEETCLLSPEGEDLEELVEEGEGEREVELLSLDPEEEEDLDRDDDLEL